MTGRFVDLSKLDPNSLFQYARLEQYFTEKLHAFINSCAQEWTNFQNEVITDLDANVGME
jgi:hypothetical protein